MDQYQLQHYHLTLALHQPKQMMYDADQPRQMGKYEQADGLPFHYEDNQTHYAL